MNHIDTKQLKEYINVRKLLEYYEFTDITDSGSDWLMTLCPYHEDSNPSFCMQQGTTAFHCWSCDAKGDGIKFVMDMDNIPFEQAILKLAGITGYSIDGDSSLAYIKNKWLINKKKEEVTKKPLVTNKRIFDLHRLATDVSKNRLPVSEAMEYLAERGFDYKSTLKLNLGYFPSNFIEVATKAGYTDTEIKVAGYGKSMGGNFRFNGRLVFPICDLEGNIVGLTARSISEDVDPKYTNTPNSDYYKKSAFLYGTQGLRREEPVILVEGNFDCVRLQSLEMNCLAQLGSSLSESQCELLASVVSSVQLMYDGDTAGRKAVLSNILPLISQGLFVGVIELPDDEDPDSFFNKHGKDEALRRIIPLTKNAIKYYVAGESKTKTIEKILCNCLKAISKIKHKFVREVYVKSLVDAFGLSKDTINIELKKVGNA